MKSNVHEKGSRRSTHVKAKLRKKFLTADYTMELYERFHSLKQRDTFIEEYKSEFGNLSIRVGLKDSNQKMTQVIIFQV